MPTWLSSEKPCVIADVDYPQGIAGTDIFPPRSIVARRMTGETVACESDEDSHARARPTMDMTTSPATNALQPLQQDVQRLLGRCLLRLQQYERLMKAIVAHHEISGPAHSLEAIRAARIEDAATKTLGTLVGQLFGSYVVTDGNGGEERDDDLPGDVISFRTRVQLSLSAQDYANTQADLKDLVSLRNTLVHHFIDQHDLWTVDGCRVAQDELGSAYTRIDQHFEQLRGWAEHMDQARCH